MRALLDLSGLRVGRLIIVGRVNVDGVSKWLCRCDCGAQIYVKTGNLTKQTTKSCGCLNRDLAARRRTTHGMSTLSEYKIWKDIKKRCFNKNSARFEDYGGRGITMYARWKDDFPAFYAHIGPRPTPQHSIERENNDGNYEPGNVVWATRKKQANNTRRNHILVCDGRSQTIAQWSEETGIDQRLIRNRIERYGWSIERSLKIKPAAS